MIWLCKCLNNGWLPSGAKRNSSRFFHWNCVRSIGAVSPGLLRVKAIRMKKITVNVFKDFRVLFSQGFRPKKLKPQSVQHQVYLGGFLTFLSFYRPAGHCLLNVFFRDAHKVKDMVETGAG